MQNNQNAMPLSVARQKFISELAKLINECQLPPFVIESVLKDMYTDVRVAAQRQLENDMKKYQSAQKAGKGVS